MIMKQELIDAMVDRITKFSPPKYADIPNVGLYLEQTAIYINQIMEPLGCIQITSSMIRNYVKQGLVPNPVRKMYYKEHISRLIAITILKAVISLDHIGMLFTWQKKAYSDEVAFDYLIREFENVLLYQFGQKETLEESAIAGTFEKTMLRSAIFSVANIVFLNFGFEFQNTDPGDRK